MLTHRINWECGDGVILICELARAKVSSIAAWEKQERWRDVGANGLGDVVDFDDLLSRPAHHLGYG